MSAIAIIPARGGSRRIPRKNIRPFHGKPIIAYSIEAAKASGLFDLIVVSTDDVEIGFVALQNGAFSFPRGDDMATDDVGTQEVTAHVLKRAGAKYDYACCIYATAPLLGTLTLHTAFEELKLRPDMHYIYSTGEDGVDAGQFYFGRAQSFIDGVPLEGNSLQRRLPPEVVCDINTEDDWRRAECLYAEFYGLRA